MKARNPDLGDYEWWNQQDLHTIKALRAVIKAARDWWAYGPWSKEHDDAKIALCKAVEALDAAERGGDV